MTGYVVEAGSKRMGTGSLDSADSIIGRTVHYIVVEYQDPRSLCLKDTIAFELDDRGEGEVPCLGDTVVLSIKKKY